jgi:hypothetical protein
MKIASQLMIPMVSELPNAISFEQTDIRGIGLFLLWQICILMHLLDEFLTGSEQKVMYYSKLIINSLYKVDIANIAP